MVGGIDKREIAKGPKAIEAEVRRRVLPLLDRGGYIPTLDHATIPEMSLADYRYYREFVTRLCEG
jgi:uroporphyrinogen decarboxylase